MPIKYCNRAQLDEQIKIKEILTNKEENICYICLPFKDRGGGGDTPYLNKSSGDPDLKLLDFS